MESEESERSPDAGQSRSVNNFALIERHGMTFACMGNNDAVFDLEHISGELGWYADPPAIDTRVPSELVEPDLPGGNGTLASAPSRGASHNGCSVGMASAARQDDPFGLASGGCACGSQPPAPTALPLQGPWGRPRRVPSMGISPAIELA
jgi:hypothetical protein